jgi:hypothetical protein
LKEPLADMFFPLACDAVVDSVAEEEASDKQRL